MTMTLRTMRSLTLTGAALGAMLFALPATSQAGEKYQRAKPMVSTQMKAMPCVNPDAPCPGNPVIFKIKALKDMKRRDAKKYVMSRLGGNFPEAKPEMIEGTTGIVIALIGARDLGQFDNGGEIQVLSGGCCSVEVTFKITFGKK